MGVLSQGMAGREATADSCLPCTSASLIALLPCLTATELPRHISASIRPAPVIRARPTKNLLAARAQEVASERYVAFASGKKQIFDALKVHCGRCSHLIGPPVKWRLKSSGGPLATSLGPRS